MDTKMYVKPMNEWTNERVKGNKGPIGKWRNDGAFWMLMRFTHDGETSAGACGWASCSDGRFFFLSVLPALSFQKIHA
jgi:hypothetical protein